MSTMSRLDVSDSFAVCEDCRRIRPADVPCPNCGSTDTREYSGNEEFQALEWLCPQAREDYVECVVKGVSPKRQARRRGVSIGAVYSNVQRAKDRLSEFYEIEK